MADLKIFINTSNGTLVAGASSKQTVEPTSLPLFFGDTLNLTIQALQLPATFNALDPSNSLLQVVSTAGLQLQLYIDDGLVGTANIYASQIAFNTDANNQFWTGTLALNSPALQGLFNGQTSVNPWLKIGYLQNGALTTIFSAKVNIGVGLPTAAVGNPPAGQTPLSQEVAAATYFPLQPKPGQAMYLASVAGKIIAVLYVDNGDGTATLQASPVN